MNNQEKIIKYLTRNQASVNNIAEYLGISRQAVHRTLNKLVADEKIKKSGQPPKVFYSVPRMEAKKKTVQATGSIVNEKTKGIIDDNFLYITPFGQMLTGWEGFATWCEEKNQDIIKMSTIYLETIDKYSHYKKDGLINGVSKMKSTFREINLDEVFYLYFYSIEIFGKTKLGQLLLFAKQSQDKNLMNQLIDSIKPKVIATIKKYKVDGVAFIPPTVKREVQLMKQIQKQLNLKVRNVSLAKIKTPVIVPQKTLGKLEDRIINARETIVVNDNGKYNNILLIDDAVGSGATLNETAKKIRNRGICKGKIVGLAITGSIKGFDIISEV